MNTNQDREKWGIVGGGILGAALALRLARSDREISLIEAAPTLGGLTSQLQFENVYWDRFYHVIEAGDNATLDLLGQLDLSHLLEWKTTKTNFFDGNVLYPLNNAFDYFRLPALTLNDKIRIALTILYGASIRDGTKLEKVDVSIWLKKWSGTGAFDALWRPLLRGKLGDNYKKASAAFIWSVIHRFYGARSGAKKTETFGYVAGGYRVILDSLREALIQRRVNIYTGFEVRSIEKREDKLSVIGADEELPFDRVVVTAPCPVASKICKNLSPKEINQLEQITYQGVVCVSMLLTKPLGGAYLTYITDETIPFTTIIEMTSLVDVSQLDGKHLVYLPKYVPSNDSMFERSDDEITDSFVGGLRRIFPDLKDNDIVASFISRARYVAALPTQNYSDLLPPLATSSANLYLCNSAQIANAALSVNESVDLANQTCLQLNALSDVSR